MVQTASAPDVPFSRNLTFTPQRTLVSTLLTDLDLEENKIGAEGAKFLAEVLPRWVGTALSRAFQRRNLFLFPFPSY